MKPFALGFTIALTVLLLVPNVPLWRYVAATVALTTVVLLALAMAKDEAGDVCRKEFKVMMVAALRVLRMGGRGGE